MKEGWEIKKLGDICSISYGTRVVQKKDGGSISPVYGGGGATFLMDRYNRENCLIVSRFAMSPKCVRYVQGKFFLNDSGLTIASNSHALIQSFLDKQVISLNDKIYSLGKGVAQKNLDIKELKLLDICFPSSLSEQERIVAELDCLSSIIERQKEQLKELDNLAQSIFYTMFGDPITNEKGWEVKKLGELVTVRGGYAFKSNLFTDDGVPILRIGNINTGRLRTSQLVFYKEEDTLSKYIVYPNDLVISLTGTAGKDDYGNVCVLDNTYPKYYLNQRNAKIELSTNICTEYLQYFLKDKRVKYSLTAINRGVRQGNISNKDIEELVIPMIPISYQQEFASKIEAIEKQKELIKQSIAETETLFNSRMDYYFN